MKRYVDQCSLVQSSYWGPAELEHGCKSETEGHSAIDMHKELHR